MQLNEIIKKMIIIIPTFLTILSCSYRRTISNEQSSEIAANNSVLDANSSIKNNRSSEEERRYFQLQQLKQNNTVYFDLNKYDIHHEFSIILDDHAIFLRENPSCKIVIEGHTDERGTPEYNISLGERRANAIKIYLQSKGIPADQSYIISYGEEKPAVAGHDETTYAKNRRAILVYQE